MAPSTKPYMRLAYTLIVIGMGIFALERMGLSNMTGTHLDGTMLSILVIAPVVLVVAGCLIFMIGKMRRL